MTGVTVRAAANRCLVGILLLLGLGLVGLPAGTARAEDAVAVPAKGQSRMIDAILAAGKLRAVDLEWDSRIQVWTWCE